MGDFIQGFIPEAIMVDIDEPLIHGTENHRGLAAPAMGIAVGIVLVQQQSVRSAQDLHDGFIGFTLVAFF